MIDPNTFMRLNETEAVLLSALVATVIAIIGILTQRAIAARQTTVQYLRATELDADMVAARRIFQQHAHTPEGLGPYALEAKKTSAEARAIRLVLNEYELIAIAIERGVFDDTTYRRWQRSVVVNNWRIAAPYVVALRTRTNNDMLYHEFEQMAVYYKGGARAPRRRFFLRRFF